METQIKKTVKPQHVKEHNPTLDKTIIDLDSCLSIISAQDLQRLQQFALQNNYPLNGILVAAFACLMYRYQNEEQFSVGLSIRKSFDPRGITALEMMLSHDMTPKQVIAKVNEILYPCDSSENKIAFSKLLEPFFCSFTSEENSQSNVSALFEISVDGSVIINSLDPRNGDDQCMSRWTDHLALIIQSICVEQDSSITLLRILSDQEIQQLHSWSVSMVDEKISQPSCLNQLFENTARTFPSRPALRCRGNEICYDAFNKKTNALARLLRSHGVEKGSHVAILLPRAQDVFIAVMGVLKAGAAYVPIDPRSPAERIGYILEDARAAMVITDAQLQQQNNLSHTCICVEELESRLSEFSTDNLSQNETMLTPDDPAYIIYTSGTTGKPKGVVLMHKTVCNLIRAESALFGVTHHDRVYQGFSVSFDASVEEMWLAWYSGAVLVAATKSEALSGPDLIKFLQAEKITVFSTVPTQISMMQSPAETVRILILGGEECHLSAIEPWLNDTRTIFNTYGPTEATVIATCGECTRGVKPSIGLPAPNYAVYILDRNLQPVPAGMPGELCIGGHCLAREYLNRPDLTEKKFVTPPFTIGNNFPQRLYRSGDRARFAPDGSIQFGGRIDDQVKLRGQRIELGEIEAALVKASSAPQAAVTLVTNSQGIQSLVAFLTMEQGQSIDENGLRNALNSFLPSYMIPAKFCTVEKLPTLPSGKVDRKKLSTLHVEQTPKTREVIGPRTETENKIHDAWTKFFDRKDICVTDNFFDIGGHSLLAANIVSELRNHQQMNDMPLQYIYQHRTIEALAAAVDADFAKRDTAVRANEPGLSAAQAHRRGKIAVCGFFQAIALYPIYMLFSTPLLIPFIIDWFNPQIGVVAWAAVSFVSMLALLPALTIMSIITKWAFIGKFKPGQYRLWSFYFFRFWVVCRLMDLVPTRIMRGTPFLTWYYRLMGAKIGKNVHIGTDQLKVCDMVTIGNNTSVNADVHLTAYRVSRGTLYIGPITVGNDCTIGTRSVLSENTAMEDHSELGELSLLPAGEVVGTGDYWEGSPASKTMNTILDSKPDSSSRAVSKPGAAYLAAFALAVFSVVLLPSVLLLPWVVAAFYMYVHVSLAYIFPATIAMAALYTVSFCLMVAGVKKLISPRDNADSYDIHSFTYIRKWVVDTLVQLSLLAVQPLYATIYLPIWLRMLGARIGKGAEISTVDHISADHLSLGEGSFIADSASVGPAVVRKGRMYVGKAEVGKRSFIGNSALIPIGSRIGDNCLIGVLSMPPRDCSRRIIDNTNWLGSPPMILPNRQESRKFKLRLTFDPPAYMVMLRGIVEFFKITMPAALTSCCYILAYWFVSEILGPVASLHSYILLAPLVILAASIGVSLLTVGIKWMLVGKYRGTQRPLWSLFLWKNEFVNSLCENLAYPLLLQMIQGTPFLPAYFRLLGSKIGKDVYMETTEITEFDLVRIDDHASLNYGATIQTHLFEDRVMKMSKLHIGENSTVGPMAVVLYDTTIKNGVVLDGLSLLMKGETLPASTAWFGIPARSRPRSGS